MTDETGQSIAAAINAINPNDAVRYSAQTLTDAQKAQARSNIGAISDVSTKADKVDGATNGNLAGLDSEGNLTDSTIPASDVTQLKNDLSQLTDGFNRTVLQGGFNQLFDMGICFGRSSAFYNFAFDNSSKKINFSLKDSSITWARIPLCLKAPNSKIYVKLISDENTQPDLWYSETDNSDVEVMNPIETKATSYIFNNTTNKPVLSCHFASQWATHSTISMGFVVVNLTKWFGAGNEPSIEEVESLLTENYYEYNDYVPSLNGLDTEALDIKMLGWSVPKECPIHNYVDADRKFHQRVGRVDLGSLNWSLSGDGTFFIATNLSPLSATTWGIDNLPNVYCSKYGNDAKWNNITTTISDKKCSSYSNQVRISDSSYTDVSTFKTAMQGVYLYYELANEIVTYVDGNEIVNAISDAYLPSKTYYNGDIVIYNNQLWKYDKVGDSGTSAVPSNANASRTSLGGEIEGINRDLSTVKFIDTTSTHITRGLFEAYSNKALGMCHLCLDFSLSGASAGELITTLPVEFRPNHDKWVFINGQKGSSGFVLIRGIVSENGEFRLYDIDNGDWGIQGVGVYFVI